MPKKAPAKRATKGKSSIAPTYNESTQTNDGNQDSPTEAIDTQAGQEQSTTTTPLANDTESDGAGDDRDYPADSAAESIEAELSSRVSRLPGEGRSGCHERLRRLARASGLPRGQGPGTAYNWALEQTNRLFSELAASAVQDEESVRATVAQTQPSDVPSPPKEDDQGVSGLAALPDHWPELPANAQLQVEIAWVTANRLRVRSGTGVDLSRALSPAPSYSALSWLETSILFPAKFADISVKATSQSDDEREHIRREKMAIEEIRDILREMLAPGDV